MKKPAEESELTPLERMLRALDIDPRLSHRVLFYAPRAYRDYTTIVDRFDVLEAIPAGHPVCLVGTPVSVDYFTRDKRQTTLFDKTQKPFRADLLLRDTHGRSLSCAIFGNVWQTRDIKSNPSVLLAGTVGSFRGEVRIESPQVVPLGFAGKVIPVYPAIRGQIDAESIQQAIADVLSQPGQIARAARALEDDLGMSSSEVERHVRLDAYKLLRFMHAPQRTGQGRYCLNAARELTAIHLCKRARDGARKSENPRAALDISYDAMRKTIRDVQHRLSLTSDQKRSIAEIYRDLEQPYPMARLLSGDVGTGKTITFLTPAIAAHRAGYQVAILAPNELISNQIAGSAAQICPDITFQVVHGRTRKIDAGSFLVGTTALISRAAKAGLHIDFLVVDEQHKFSREQREALVGDGTNYLEATATAIPRTMAMVTHAGMQVSQLRERPFKREVRTRLALGKTHRRAMFDLMTATLEAGKQIAIVYPSVERGDCTGEATNRKGQMLDVEAATESWEKVFPGRVAMLHGRVSPQDKAEALRAFRAAERDILVCSTVIEVGADIPNLGTIIVVNAERHGIAQLHQLRGRVARQGGIGHCVLYCPGDVSEETLARLQMVEAYDDGFMLAEADLQQRGFGDLSSGSDLQSGKALGAFFNISIHPEDLHAAETRVLSCTKKNVTVLKV